MSILVDLLPLAIGVAISPLTIMIELLFLISNKARTCGIAYMAGVVVSLTLTGIVMMILAVSGTSILGLDDFMVDAYAAKVVLGFALLYLAYRFWQKRPAPGEEPKMPVWLSAIEKLTSGKAFGLALLGGLNLKNLILTFAAALIIVEVNDRPAIYWLRMALFVFVACITVTVPAGLYLIKGSSAQQQLNEWKTWLVVNTVTISVVMFLILGILLIVRGLEGLPGI
jgi:hypothetical protein